MKGFLVAGTASGVGKTTVALAIAAASTRRGLRVQMFKGGPDFLDTGHHTKVSRRTARNVDTRMLSAGANREVVGQAAVDADVVLVEGMMGLFDGKDGTTELGSICTSGQRRTPRPASWLRHLPGDLWRW